MTKIPLMPLRSQVSLLTDKVAQAELTISNLKLEVSRMCRYHDELLSFLDSIKAEPLSEVAQRSLFALSKHAESKFNTFKAVSEMESRKCCDYFKVKLELLKADFDRCIEENTRLRQKLYIVTAQQKKQSTKLDKVSAALDEYISLTPLIQAQ